MNYGPALSLLILPLAACASHPSRTHAVELRYARVDPKAAGSALDAVDISGRIPVGYPSEQARFALAPGFLLGSRGSDVNGTPVDERVGELRLGLDVEFASTQQPWRPYLQAGVTYVDGHADFDVGSVSGSALGGFAEAGLRFEIVPDGTRPYLTAAYRSGFGLSDDVNGTRVDLDYGAWLLGLGISF